MLGSFGASQYLVLNFNNNKIYVCFIKASKPVKLNKKKRLKLSKSKVLSKEKTNAKAVKSDSHLKYQGCAKKVVVVDLEEDAFYSPTGDFNLQSPGTDTYFDAEDKLLVASGDWFAEPDKKMAEEGEETPGEEVGEQ